MSKAVIVHGYAGTEREESVLVHEWLPAMRDGLAMAGFSDLNFDCEILSVDQGVKWQSGDLGCQAKAMKAQASSLVRHWYEDAKSRHPSLRAYDADDGEPIETIVERLRKTRYFSGVPIREIFGIAQDVYAHAYDPACREECARAVRDRISKTVRVVIGNSLGSISAYDAVHSSGDSINRTLITLGSPLGKLSNIFGDSLLYSPSVDAVTEWVNIVDRYDVVASGGKLSPLFGELVKDVEITNLARARGVRSYLATREFGCALAKALRA